jgi:AcrR family transcriptional regulator
VALRDARRQLFAAAERILLRSGPSALTSRSVTDEAGVAKGVLHRHFTDFDDFLAEFVLDNVNRLDVHVTALQQSAGTGDVVASLTEALSGVFGSTAVAVVDLVSSRATLRARLSDTWPAGVPVLTDAAALIASYLEDERAHGRIAAKADVDTLAAMLIGTCHLLYAGALDTPPAASEVRRVVAAVLAGATR